MVILPPEWLNENRPIDVNSGQFMITATNVNEISKCTNIEIKVSGDKPLLFERARQGDRVQFKYLGETYFLDLLQFSGSTFSGGRVEISISKSEV